MKKRSKRYTRKKTRSSKRKMRGGRLTEDGLRFLISVCRNVHTVENIQRHLQINYGDRAATFSKSDIKLYLDYMGASISTKHKVFAIIKRKDREDVK